MPSCLSRLKSLSSGHAQNRLGSKRTAKNMKLSSFVKVVRPAFTGIRRGSSTYDRSMCSLVTRRAKHYRTTSATSDAKSKGIFKSFFMHKAVSMINSSLIFHICGITI
ncbi:uncharacterized protein LOC114746669 isoform X2 [Neltuma alba]|uniref:uncharacterized protein LOC114746669 isoform X2 n=1 Tax=Neltuma alba TaxID=207710 RepID=UPI0010A53E4B|nr:uncharacterized protein LOC114746669 isoform X2 [Prosopis alba]